SAVRAPGVFHQPGARLPLQAGVIARDGRLRDVQVLVRTAADLEDLLVEREELTGEVVRVRREGDEHLLRLWIEVLRRRTAERSSGRETFPGDLHLARRERGRVEEPHVPRARPKERIVAEAPVDLLYLVDGEPRRDVEHDLRAHGLRP